MSNPQANGDASQEIPFDATKPAIKTISVGTDATAIIPQFWAPPGMETDKDVIPIDINQQGQLLLKKAPSFQDTVAQLINQIWEEAPGSFETLKLDEVSLEADKQKDEAEEDDEFSIEKFHQMRANLAQRIHEAHNESLIALNLMNVIVSNPNINPSVTAGNEKEFTQPPIPPETLRATYANPPRLDLKRRLRDMKLQLASKRQQISSATELLSQRVIRVREVNQIEKAFWRKLIQLRSLGWMVQSPKPPLSYRGPRPFYVNYGFSHAGSKFNMSGLAIITRCEETPGDLKIEPQFEHRVSKAVVLQMISSKESTDSKPKLEPEVLSRFLLPIEPLEEGLVVGEQTLASHRLLQHARNTLLETELFFHLVQEARALDSITSLSKDSLAIQIDDTRQLHIMLVDIDPQNENPSMNETPSSDQDQELCFDLKLMMLGRLRLHHHHNLELRRSRLTQNLPVAGVHPTPLSITSVRDPAILRSSIEVTRYYYFYQQIWNTTLSVIRKIPQAETRVKPELIPLEGIRTAMFQSSHLLQIIVDNAHFVQFRLSAPRHLQALLPKASLLLDREVGMFAQLLSEEIQSRLSLL